MKHSIRLKFSFVFISILTGTMFLCLFFNLIFIKRAFESYNKEAIFDTYDRINEYSDRYSFASVEFRSEIRLLCEKHNMSIIVMDDNNNIVGSYQSNDSVLSDHLLDYFLGTSDDVYFVSVLEKKGNYTLQIVKDKDNESEYIELLGLLNNGNYFLIRTAFEGIESYALFANRFFMEIGIAGLILGVFAVMFFTSRITRPILQLNKISEKMANLDFDAHYVARGDTEIDRLGENFNKLSKKLESTISELKTANSELRQDIKKKEELDEIRKEFISNVSHELKTPIALIQGYAEGLKEGIDDSPENRAFYCDVIIDESQKMNLLVKNLLSLNEIESGSARITMERFNLSEMLRNCVTSMSLICSQRNINVNCNFDDAVFVWSDEFKTEEVFTNFLSNAVNHSSDNSEIDVTVLRKEGKVRISVYNRGECIPEESLPHIWDKFYKVDKARTREYGGSGVGLSIVKAIMESLNEEFGVENKEDGVEFFFELPTE